MNIYPPYVILWGGTGQSKVVRPIIESYNAKVIAVFDDTPGLVSPFPDVELFQGRIEIDKWLEGRDRSKIGFCITIGNPHGRVRCELHDKLSGLGLKPVTVVHPFSSIAENAVIGPGSQVLAGAIIGPEAKIGRQCIINTNASIDHESVLFEGAELAPGATVCGLVVVEENGWICAGATVLPRLRIGADSIVGAGSVVIDDVPAGATVVGVPGRKILKEKDNSQETNDE